MHSRQLWYTRRGHKIRGPFPSALITRYLLLGRVTETDEISIDQINWIPVSDVPELIPEELKADMNDPVMRERLIMAKYREDERQYGDRRAHQDDTEKDQRAGRDRRRREPAEVIQHRAVRTEVLKAGRTNKETSTKRIIFLLLSIVVITVMVLIYKPESKTVVLNCDSTPGPHSIWNNCNLEGVILSQLDLSESKIRNANLIGAKINNTLLKGSDLAYTNLATAQLIDSDLHQAIMLGTVLRNADLSRTNLANANLSYAVLEGANLSDVSLKQADLRFADLTGANVTRTDFSGADLTNAVWVDKSICASGSIGQCKP